MSSCVVFIEWKVKPRCYHLFYLTLFIFLFTLWESLASVHSLDLLLRRFQVLCICVCAANSQLPF